jgi:hypothetical protein
VRLVHAIVRTAVDGDRSLAPLRFGLVYFACSFKCARDLDTEVARYRRARLCRVMVEKNVVAIRPQPWLASNELPDLVQGRPPRGANRARRDLTPHSGQLAGVNSLQVDGDGHSSIVSQIVIACRLTSGIEAQAVCEVGGRMPGDDRVPASGRLRSHHPASGSDRTLRGNAQTVEVRAAEAWTLPIIVHTGRRKALSEAITLDPQNFTAGRRTRIDRFRFLLLRHGPGTIMR